MERNAIDERARGTFERGYAWWKSPTRDEDGGKRLAANVIRVCTALETAQIPRRWRNYVYYRYFTGSPFSAQFAYGMAKRPMSFISTYGDYEFQPVRYNVIGVTSDVYVNRALSHKSFVEYVPEHGNWSQRQLSTDIQEWIEGGWEAANYWKERLAMGLQGLCYGSGYLWPRIGMDKKIGYECIDTNEMIFSNYDDPDPKWAFRREWRNREELYDCYGVDDESKTAILNAPGAHSAFWFGSGSLDTEDIIPLVRGWRVQHVDGKAGREALCIPGYTLEDKPLNVARFDDVVIRWDFHQRPSSCIGQGIPELTLELNQGLDEILAVAQESWMRAGTGKWIVGDASGVNVDALGDTVAAYVSYTSGTEAPKYVAPEPIGEWALKAAQFLIDLLMKRVHISELAVQGEQPRALTSAIALERWSQIDDMNFLEIIGRLEDVDKRAANAMIRLGKEAKPSYTYNGRERQIIDWERLKIDGDSPSGVRAYNTGRFGQSVPAKLQELSALLAQGSISREQYDKYLEKPDLGDLLDKLNAPMDGVDRQLEKMLKPGADYIPPSPFVNLQYAKQAAEAAYIISEGQGADQSTLDLLLQYRAAIQDMIKQQSTPDAAAPDGKSAPAIPDFGKTAQPELPTQSQASQSAAQSVGQ